MRRGYSADVCAEVARVPRGFGGRLKVNRSLSSGRLRCAAQWRKTCERCVTGPGTGGRAHRRHGLGLSGLQIKNGESSRLRPGRTRVRSSRTPTAQPRRAPRSGAGSQRGCPEDQRRGRGRGKYERGGLRSRVEERLDNRDTALDRREGELDERRRRAAEAEEALRARQEELRAREAQQLRALEEISGLTRDEAERRLFAGLETELEDRMGRLVLERTMEAEEGGRKLAVSSPRLWSWLASDLTSESTVKAMALLPTT